MDKQNIAGLKSMVKITKITITELQKYVCLKKSKFLLVTGTEKYWYDPNNFSESLSL